MIAGHETKNLVSMKYKILGLVDTNCTFFLGGGGGGEEFFKVTQLDG